jgi:hypothetical protein
VERQKLAAQRQKIATTIALPGIAGTIPEAGPVIGGVLSAPGVIFGGLILGLTSSSTASEDEDETQQDLYRAVSPAELKQIQMTKTFVNPPGIESKYFATTQPGAAAYAKMANKAFGESYAVVRTDIAKSQITPDMRATVDRGIAAVAVPTAKLNALSPPFDMGVRIGNWP